MKKKKKKLVFELHVPEGLGLVVGFVFLISLQILHVAIEDEQVKSKITLLFTVSSFLLLLGFADDVLVIRWKHKIFISALVTIPLVGYTWNSTNVIITNFISHIFHKSNIELNLGVVFSVFVFLLTVFCINSINIYAGINGLEVGQSIVISVFSVVYAGLSFIVNSSSESLSHSDANCKFVTIASLPFIFTSAALFYYNKYPSKVFVGDSYTLYAGATLAGIGIAGQFPFILLLFFSPQVLNFVLSIPQLFSSYYPPSVGRFLHRFFSELVVENIMKCPRHRVPMFNAKLKRMEASPNLTLINAALYLFGPQKEPTLVAILLLFQVVVDSIIIALCFLHILPWL